MGEILHHKYVPGCAMIVEKSRSEQRILEDACLEFDVDPDLVDELIRLEQAHERRLRRRGLPAELKTAIKNYVQDHEDDYS